MARRGRSPKRIKAEAFLYAEGVHDPETDAPPPVPYDLAVLGYIDRFGVTAVLGRPVLSQGEIMRMLISERIVDSYRSRKSAENRGKWAQDNPRADELLNEIEVMIYNADRDN